MTRFVGRLKYSTGLSALPASAENRPPPQSAMPSERMPGIPVFRSEGLALWREGLFSALARNAGSPVEYFNLPTNRVIELGTQIEI